MQFLGVFISPGSLRIQHACWGGRGWNTLSDFHKSSLTARATEECWGGKKETYLKFLQRNVREAAPLAPSLHPPLPSFLSLLYIDSVTSRWRKMTHLRKMYSLSHYCCSFQNNNFNNEVIATYYVLIMRQGENEITLTGGIRVPCKKGMVFWESLDKPS